MEGSIHGNPPLSPVLVAGVALRPMPLAFLQPVLDAAMVVMRRRHAGLFARLADLAGTTFLIDPVDLPFCFLLRAAPTASRLVAVDKSGGEAAPTATIRGPLVVLIRLLEGKLDGDALFFSRDLVVEGHTEAVVMLRNAIDGAGIDLLEDMLSALGPLARPVEIMATGAAAVLARAERDLGLLARALLAPVADRYEGQAAEIRELRATVAELSRKLDESSRRGRAAPAGPEPR